MALRSVCSVDCMSLGPMCAVLCQDVLLTSSNTMKSHTAVLYVTATLTCYCRTPTVCFRLRITSNGMLVGVIGGVVSSIYTHSYFIYL